jgi:hypothetical protein
MLQVLIGDQRASDGAWDIAGFEQLLSIMGTDVPTPPYMYAWLKFMIQFPSS